MHQVLLVLVTSEAMLRQCRAIDSVDSGWLEGVTSAKKSELIERPRQTLGDKTPTLFHALLTANQYTPVATTTRT